MNGTTCDLNSRAARAKDRAHLHHLRLVLLTVFGGANTFKTATMAAESSRSVAVRHSAAAFNRR